MYQADLAEKVAHVQLVYNVVSHLVCLWQDVVDGDIARALLDKVHVVRLTVALFNHFCVWLVEAHNCSLADCRHYLIVFLLDRHYV